MIGDPKQAIYAFRGADIYTYLAARRATSGRLHSLDTNYRSSKAMVAAVNQVFLQAEAREAGRGAFLFREADDNPLPFVEVRAKGRGEQLLIDGVASAALHCWQLQSEEPVSSSVYRQQLAASCASHIVALLNGGQQGTAGFQNAEGELRPCLPPTLPSWCVTGMKRRWCAPNWPHAMCAVCTCQTKTRYSRLRRPTMCWPGSRPAPSQTRSACSRRPWPASPWACRW